jgi:hypothetical protein
MLDNESEAKAAGVTLVQGKWQGRFQIGCAPVARKRIENYARSNSRQT